MKWLRLFLIILLLTKATTIQAQGSGFRIVGVLKGVGNKKILLGNKPSGYGQGFKIVYFDSCFAHNDSFSFKGAVREPNFYSIEVSGSKQWRYFILEGSVIKIKGNADSIWKAKVLGSKQNDTYLEYKKTIDNPYNDTLDFYWDKIGSAKKNNDSSTITRYKDSLSYYRKKNEQEMLVFLMRHPSSFISLYNLYSNLTTLNVDTAKKYYRLLDKKMQSHSLGKKVFHELFVLPQLLIINKQVPNFSLPDSNGRNINVIDYRGKYVLLDFWASWCAPCLQEMPSIRELYKSYHTKGFEILGITLDSDKNKWTNAVSKYKIDWPTLSDLNGAENKVAGLFGIRQIPVKLLINPDGKLVLKNPSLEELKQFLSEAIAH